MTHSLREHRRLLYALIRRLPVICMLILISLSRDVLGQNSEGGAIGGKVVDSWQGNPVPAVIVTIRGTTLATETDRQGVYQVKGVPAGSYTLVLNKNGYERAIITDVKVANGVTSKADGKMGPVFFELDAFEVMTEPIPEQKLEILQTRKKQSVVMDALGEEYISQIGASDATDVAKKITGVTIQEGKFVVVRGLSDRYTSSSLNGAEIPSADADRQAAQLDLIPASMIKRMEVRKTFTPDMPGGFAGGAVNIVTKSFPNRFTYSVSVGTSYNANNNLRDDFAGSVRSDTDFAALDDGMREIPSTLVQVYSTLDAVEASGGVVRNIPFGAGFINLPNVSRGRVADLDNPLFDPLWQTLFGKSGREILTEIFAKSEPVRAFGSVPTSSPLNSSYSMSVGDNYKLFGKESGFLAGMNYSQGFSMPENRMRQKFTGTGTQVLSENPSVITNGVTSVKWGANFTTGIKPSETHEIGFNFARVQASDDFRARMLTDDVDVSAQLRRYQSVYTERSLENYQVFGRHEFPELADLKFDWTTSIASVGQDIPNISEAAYAERGIAGSGIFASGSAAVEPQFSRRIWRNVSENNFNNRVDLELPFTLREELEGSFKSGFYQSDSTREYREDGYQLDKSTADDGTGEDGLAELTAGNVGITAPTGIFDYDGTRDILAYYAMMELPVTSKMRLVGGGRVEGTKINVSVLDKERNTRLAPITRDRTDILPALGSVISPSDKWKVTLHWSETIARPTYREIASAFFTDYQNLRFIRGNPTLRFSESQNLDMRVELFPKAGEIISFGAFYKDIVNPIELRRYDQVNPNFEYFNPESGKAIVMGTEFEYRRNLSALLDYLSNYTIGFNFSYIFSEVENLRGTPLEATKTPLFFQETRPLFDQSPIIANVDLAYKNERLALEYNLAYNFRDRRLSALVLNGPDYYEDSFGSLNFSIAKRFGKENRFKIKLSANNLLDPKVSRSIDEEFQHLLAPGTTQYRDVYRRGRSYGVSLSYTF